MDSGEAAVAFSMYPTTMDDLFTVSDMGEIMPLIDLVRAEAEDGLLATVSDQMIEAELAALRRNYSLSELTESSVDPDSFTQFAAWFNEALRSELLEPAAMTISTVGTNSGRLLACFAERF